MSILQCIYILGVVLTGEVAEWSQEQGPSSIRLGAPGSSVGRWSREVLKQVGLVATLCSWWACFSLNSAA